jgi:hypothetical protein
MMKVRKREAIAAAAVAAALLVAPACAKKPRQTTAAGVEAVEAERAAAPSMFEAIPADTPYLFASIEPMPADVWAMYAEMASAMRGGIGALVAQGLDDEATPAELRFVLALFETVTEDVSKEGMSALGISADPRFAIYGLGALPVARFEIADADRLRDTIARLEADSGYELPTRELAGHRVWALGEPMLGAAAILGQEVVMTFGTEATIEATFEVLLGRRDVGGTLSETDLRALVATQGVTPFGVGYVDTRRLAALLLGAGEGVGAEITAPLFGGEQAAPAACASAVDHALGHVPRIGFGYTELSRERMAMRGSVELSDELAQLMSAAQTSVPGLTGQFGGSPLLAIGAAVDLRAGARALERIAAELRAVGDACEDAEIQQAAANLSAAARGSVPPPFSSIKGGVLVVNSFDVAGMSAEGYALIGIDRPTTLLRLARPFVPQLAGIEVASDGVFRPLPPALAEFIPLELGLTYAVGARGVALAAGESGRQGAEAAMQIAPATSPLFAMAYDYQAFLRLLLGVMPAAGTVEEQASRAILESFASYLGPVHMWITPIEGGLGLESVMSMGAGAR